MFCEHMPQYWKYSRRPTIGTSRSQRIGLNCWSKVKIHFQSQHLLAIPIRFKETVVSRSLSSLKTRTGDTAHLCQCCAVGVISNVRNIVIIQVFTPVSLGLVSLSPRQWFHCQNTANQSTLEWRSTVTLDWVIALRCEVPLLTLWQPKTVHLPDSCRCHHCHQPSLSFVPKLYSVQQHAKWPQLVL